jgi:SAM-dependent methyltransferase
MEEALFRLYADLPRQGPGSDAVTLDIMRRLPPLPTGARVLDLGCGSGRQTLVLARELGVPVIAVDLYREFLDRLERAAAEQGLADRIQVREADMAAPGEPDGSVDLIWSEGAAYNLGFGAALAAWRRLLKPGGLAVISESTWLTDDPPEEPAAFWHAAYPGMGTVAANVAMARDRGYEVLETMVLPATAWWENYYDPLRRRMAELQPEAADDAELAALLAETATEIALFERWSAVYGYVFYVLRALGETP